MTSTSLEKLRQTYQDIEDCRKQAIKLLILEPKTIKEEAYINHYVAKNAKEIQNLSNKIIETLDGDEIKRVDDPIAAFNSDFQLRFDYYSQIEESKEKLHAEEEEVTEAPKTMNDLVYDIQGSPHLSLFYDNDRYQEWRRLHEEEKHKKKKSKPKKQIVVSENDEALKKFSGEECFGKYLDLTEIFMLYLNTNPKNALSYLDFLTELQNTKDFSFIPKGDLGDNIISKLIEYLMSFIERSQPFFPLEETVASIVNTFNEKYVDQKVQNKPFFCTFCNKQLNDQKSFEDHQKMQSHIRNIEKINRREGGLDEVIRQRQERARDRAQNVFIALQLIMQLKQQFDATIANTKRRQTISSSVIEAEQHDLDAPIVFDDKIDEDDEQFFNPKGLPLGWDGKPIPIWLYKLHGLSVEYKCEICGNKSYWGQVAFERHFFQSTHINHLKMLGIPNTKHFVNITKINDAVTLFEKIKNSLSKDVWQKGEEEVETDDGTVMSRKLYDDMVRQGLIKPKQK